MRFCSSRLRDGLSDGKKFKGSGLGLTNSRGEEAVSSCRMRAERQLLQVCHVLPFNISQIITLLNTKSTLKMMSSFKTPAVTTPFPWTELKVLRTGTSLPAMIAQTKELI